MRRVTSGFLMFLLLGLCPGCLEKGQDVICGDHRCEGDETFQSCPEDCLGPYCGNGLCQPGEDELTCPLDCLLGPRCGDGLCQGTEDPSGCPVDCGTCSNRCSPGGNVVFCGLAGQDEVLACPTEHGSLCAPLGPVFWCDCGSVGAGGVCYQDPEHAIDLITCENGALGLYYCQMGAYCDDADGSADCYCDNIADGICPDAQCNVDPDCGLCTPSCAGRECGDNGCGGTCGSCGLMELCNETTGRCQESCTPVCTLQTCGTDGCGGSCGPCLNGNCHGLLCEDTCGVTCPGGQTCVQSGTIHACVSPGWLSLDVDDQEGFDVFEETVHDASPLALPPLSRPVARCLHNEATETLYAWGYDRSGRWHVLAALEGWTGPGTVSTLSGGAEAFQVVTSGVSGMSDGRYTRDSGGCTILDLPLNLPSGWGLSLTFDCPVVGPSGHFQAHATIYCSGFRLP